MTSEAGKDKCTRSVSGHENAKWVAWKAGACRMQIRKGALRAGWVLMASGFPKRRAPDLQDQILGLDARLGTRGHEK